MLLFLIGIDITTLVIGVVLIVVFSVLVLYLSKRLLWQIMPEASEQKVQMLSRLIAFVIAPALVVLIFALFIFVAVKNAPKESQEQLVRAHYEMMEKDIARDLKIGMTLEEVVEVFGSADTTQAVLVYDLSLPDAKETYFLEITIEEGIVTDFHRKQ